MIPGLKVRPGVLTNIHGTCPWQLLTLYRRLGTVVVRMSTHYGSLTGGESARLLELDTSYWLALAEQTHHVHFVFPGPIPVLMI